MVQHYKLQLKTKGKLNQLHSKSKSQNAFNMLNAEMFHSKCLRKSEAVLFVTIDIISDNSKRHGCQADCNSKGMADMIVGIFV